MACAAVIAVAAAMAWWGAEAEVLRESMRYFLAYWGIFVLLLVLVVYFVLLDLRFIHLQYIMARRELLRRTLEEESFRKALIEAQRKNADGADSQGE